MISWSVRQEHLIKKVWIWIHDSLCLAPIWSPCFWDTCAHPGRHWLKATCFVFYQTTSPISKARHTGSELVASSPTFIHLVPASALGKALTDGLRRSFLHHPITCFSLDIPWLYSHSFLCTYALDHFASSLLQRCFRGCIGLISRSKKACFSTSFLFKYAIHHICVWCHGNAVRASCAFSQIVKPLNVMSLFTTSN